MLFAYATEPFETVPLLQSSVVAQTNDTLTLDSGVVLAAYPCRPAALRGIRSRIVQHLYPYAKPVVLTYMKPRQRFWEGDLAHGGWYRANAGLKRMLVRAGLPARAPS